MKHLLAITIALLPSAVLAEQFTPQQMLEVMTKSPENRDVRVQDAAVAIPMYQGDGEALDWHCSISGSPLAANSLPSACAY